MTEKKVKVVTLGCEKNLVDSEIMSGLVNERGYTLVEDKEEATVIIVNTCGFIDAAKEESVNTILDMADLKQTASLKALIVSGCLTQRYKQELMQEMPEIDGIVGTGDFDKINDIIDKALAGKKNRCWWATRCLIMKRSFHGRWLLHVTRLTLRSPKAATTPAPFVPFPS